MILHPLSRPASSSAILPAWDVVAATQKQDSPAWWLIAQPDHAALAGDLAARFALPEFGRLDADVVRAIALHDAGWAKYDGGGEAGGGQGTVMAVVRDPSGRPMSFLQAPVSMFVEAWSASIQCAEQKAGAGGGLMVSGHFRRLAQHRLDSVCDSCEDTGRLHAFLESETKADERRLRQQRRTGAEVERLVDLLQFCDLLSLYLCCGSRTCIQFPHLVAGRPVVLRRRGELCILEPSPFSEQVSLGVTARREPASDTEAGVCVLPVLLR
jgi:hypothetical protein